MKTREEFSREIGRLEKEADELKKEMRLHEYCRSHGMDYHDSGDYARAVNGLSKERRGAGNAATGLPDGNKTECELLMSKSVGEAGSSCYNGNDIAARISRIIEGLENVSRYGWFDDMGDRIKKKWNEAKEKTLDIGKAVLKGTGSRRNIRNNTDTTICVTGNTKDGPELVYLRGRGANSSPALYDADGVVILPGQRFYATESEMRRRGTTYTSGVIKVGDVAFGWGNAEVCNAPGEKDTYYVNASGTEHHTLAWAIEKKWKLP